MAYAMRQTAYTLRLIPASPRCWVFCFSHGLKHYKKNMWHMPYTLRLILCLTRCLSVLLYMCTILIIGKLFSVQILIEKNWVRFYWWGRKTFIIFIIYQVFSWRCHIPGPCYHNISIICHFLGIICCSNLYKLCEVLVNDSSC